LLLQGIDGGPDLCGIVLCFAVVFEVRDDLVDDLEGRVALALGIADLLWVAAALLDEVVAVYPAVLAAKHMGDGWQK
jgi:hypothetical protein